MLTNRSLMRQIEESLRSHKEGTGHRPDAEELKHSLSGLYSRRISQRDRLIYRFDESHIYIFAIGGHYDDY